MSGIEGYGLGPLDGMLSLSSLVKTEENWWLRISALLRLSLCRKPSWFLRGATPIDS